MDALSRDFRVSCPWELLYADDLAISSDPLVDLKNRLATRKTSLESHSLRVNVNKTKILVSSAEHTKISARNPKYPCVVCTVGIGANSILCTSCDLWVHNKRSGITDHLTDNRTFVCRKCTGEIVPAAIASFKKVNIGLTVFMLNPPSNILVIRLVNVVVVLTQSLHVLSHRGKHSKNLYLFSVPIQHVCKKSAFLR